ncbi:MAG: SIR2 family protein [Verrucomicrobia bacterium]|nr:SIR2 family protein [Verrucomicrobiota bacterium]
MSKTPLDLAHTLAQECVSSTPVIILGSGYSAAFGIPGMPKLKAHLLTVTPPTDATPEEHASWNGFHARLSAVDLETALNEVRLSDRLTSVIVDSTWEFLAPYDYAVFEQLLKDRQLLPLTALYKHLFNSTAAEINVVTPNYDRLAEYAADAAGINHYTGFTYGYLRSRCPQGSVRMPVNGNRPRTVNVWKVHGSFDLFWDADNIVMSVPVGKVRPAGMTPIIVTPGIEKYRKTHDEPFLSVKTEADKALRTANGYFCVGYGFNDPHLQTTLVERCREQSVPLVLLSKTISATARTFLSSGKVRKYLALEECGSGSRMFCPDYPVGVELPASCIWQLREFLKLIIL